MFKIIQEFSSLLNGRQRSAFILLQMLIIVAALMEITSIVAIGQFVALVADISAINTADSNKYINYLYNFFGASSAKEFVLWFGALVFIILCVNTFIAVLNVRMTAKVSIKIGLLFSNRLYNYYIHKPWLHHTKHHSSYFIKQISAEVGRTSSGVIMPCMHVNTKLLLISLMSIALIIVNPVITITALGGFMVFYFVIYQKVKSKLAAHSIKISALMMERQRLMMEGFNGIKDVLLLNCQANFSQRFAKNNQKQADISWINSFLTMMPRYLIELIAFGSVILVSLYLLKGNMGDVVVQSLVIYALAGFKILPAFQQIYSSIATIRSNIHAFHMIKADLKDAKHQELTQINNNKSIAPMSLKNALVLDNVSFAYPNKKNIVLNNINLTVPVNKVVGLVGHSGSGKSTIIDILIGLIPPKEGQLIVDGIPINQNNKHAWQKNIGYVPQSIFLSDESVAQNIAFGLPLEEIDLKKVMETIELAQLSELIAQLPDGINTHLGERGVRLSGGQRQRIGIARAFYHNAQILVLDEATNSLDGITEKMIIDTIHNFTGKKTIIMIAHRLKTVKECDIIYLIDNGKVIDSGTYSDLEKRNDMFKKMVAHA